ncbi:NUDIX domain-containing protein [Allonocardiopsis opalescens]|uniref:ADP-ribose pyrophosphatase YjhB (NUDIX family) n=1 Tax=Allonocardiopsis opalescens TaxID=1144618 RepID=A0A2T0Q4V2_9ACTN|nr:NUDIX hydrolase [Allonocardiopsis opalescens]PRX98845.1 ADP-ribose pyrophosphatase YjhB (NUDIX family) [Allonocardiopsis opalescens]
MAAPKLLPDDVWFAQLPTAYLAAAALLTDGDGRVLVVKPNYREHWALPGGVVEHGEEPHRGCEREVAEEVGLAIEARELLVCHWNGPAGARPRPFVSFVFDGGTVAPGAAITLQAEELDDHAFATPQEAAALLHPVQAPRLAAALTARSTGRAAYLID